MTCARSFRSLRPITLSLLGISHTSTTRSFTTSSGSYRYSTKSTTTTKCTRRLIRNPSPTAPRESPTPLIFVRTKGLASVYGLKEEEGGEGWHSWSGMFAEKGWMGVEIDIEVEVEHSSNFDNNKNQSSKSALDVDVDVDIDSTVLKAMTSNLSSQIRLLAIPFPPVLLASGPSTILTQAYISDNPASGLILISPPNPELNDKLFNYEPKFPILVVGKKEGRLGIASEGGVGRGGKGVEVVDLVDGNRGERTRTTGADTRAQALIA